MFLDLGQFKQLRTTHSKPNAITIEALWSNLEYLYGSTNLLFDWQGDQMAIEKINSKQFKLIMSRIRSLEARLNQHQEKLS